MENQDISQSKKTFLIILAILAILLIILPFTVTFNQFLTILVVKVKVYRVFQETLVPILVKIIAAFFSLFGIRTYTDQFSALYIDGMGKQVVVEIAWNCIGWQSLVLFLLTTLVGTQGNYNNFSKLQCILLGIFGTIFINIFRILIVVLVAFFIGKYPAIIFHDYFSTLFVITWLFLFWWLSYKYILMIREE